MAQSRSSRKTRPVQGSSSQGAGGGGGACAAQDPQQGAGNAARQERLAAAARQGLVAPLQESLGALQAGKVRPEAGEIEAGVGRWMGGGSVGAQLRAGGQAGLADALGGLPMTADQRARAVGGVEASLGVDIAGGGVIGDLGKGRPLDAGLARRVGDAFGRSFGDVVVHTGPEAAGLAESQGAQAVTVGQHIAFGAGRYQPGAPEGQALVAHELAHVAQQDGAVSGELSAAGGLSLEQDADGAARGALAAMYGAGEGEVPRQRSGLRLAACDKGAKDAKDTATAAKGPEIAATQEAMGQKVKENMDAANQGGDADSGIWYSYNYEYRNPDKFKEDMRSGYADPVFFDKTGWMSWRLKPGMSASDGIRAWLKGLTIAECLTSIIAMQIDALRAALGDDRFDELYGSKDGTPSNGLMVIKPGVQGTPLAGVLDRSEAAKKGEEGSIGKRPNLKVGEWYYFYNHPKYLLKHPGGAWQGENAVYGGVENGEQMWSGLGASNKTEDGMYEEMVEAYNGRRNVHDFRALVKGHLSDVPEASGSSPDYEAIYAKYKDRIPDMYREDKGEFQEKITKANVLNDPAYTLGGTTRKGGFLMRAGTGFDTGEVEALRSAGTRARAA